ncbi:hypothetical protein BDV34DRAFT_216826 [Aspergillus parasiticus]|uniref:S-adenosyl-L-methionine-dependent methyltransferase n=1 Tax=Aspergillus parasiticus TaxID=5067 RepID=A0A5N6D7F8_ASPPA|nr:hypothetical protein BDV34DRAFT_216826 [Aspergillus parasiticus]
MVQLRKKRFRLAGQHGAFGKFELNDHYGLEQQVLNLNFDPPTMWMNVGFWKNNPQSLPEACQGLLEELLNEAGLSVSGDQRFSVLEVGCGCAEPAHYLRKQFPGTFDQYIGITLNGCQADYATKRLAATHEMAQDKGHSCHSHVYCANAANPSSWPENLRRTVEQVSHQKFATGSHSLWLLALDTLYHFAPNREPILTYACQNMNASLMATDIMIPASLSLLDRIKLRLVFFGLQVPWKNIMTQDQYLRMLIQCGYKEENITMTDISEHCFEGFDKFTREHMKRWEAMGGSNVIPRAVRMMGWLMGWWARSGTVREYLIVAKK